MTLRREVSLLLSQGHADARMYPIGMLVAEARIATERVNHMLVIGGILDRAAAASVWSREGGRHFADVIRGLNGGN